MQTHNHIIIYSLSHAFQLKLLHFLSNIHSVIILKRKKYHYCFSVFVFNYFIFKKKNNKYNLCDFFLLVKRCR